MEEKAKIVAAKIHNLRFWVSDCDPETLQNRFRKYLTQVGFVILNFTDHHFPEVGYTAFWMLAESHLAIHTFPEEGWSYIELSSCNKQKAEKFYALLKESDLKVNWNGHGIEICLPD
ncbi:S-adenosylmethionine decarboxylase family protein [Labilibaculum sp.]|uniref:S-adenosylmethionine decarboxylase family protein n=1 Tax=Labilibaculum sp. TaxID=2060723 RepID=UPI00356A1DCF